VSQAWPSGIGRPAQRALVNAGIGDLAALAKWREAEVAALHGMGPKALGVLREALAAQGLSFAT
jgi:predicted flap endonuclease-1-like 5' DNA nuclease